MDTEGNLMAKKEQNYKKYTDCFISKKIEKYIMQQFACITESQRPLSHAHNFGCWLHSLKLPAPKIDKNYLHKF